MSWRQRNWRFYKLLKERGDDTDVFWMMTRLMCAWRDDPERLGVIVTLYRELGYCMELDEVSHGQGLDGKFVEQISEDEAFELVKAALEHRPRRVLRSRAYGLLVALLDLAPIAEEAIGHRDAVEFGRIDCRRRSIEEMGEYWRQLDKAKS